MTTKYMLCSFKTCPWVQRAAIVLQAKHVAYEITYIDRDNRPAWFLAVSPHSKVPVLQIDGKEALFESNAIAEFLEETAAPRLHPEDPVARARNRAWTDFLRRSGPLLSVRQSPDACSNAAPSSSWFARTTASAFQALCWPSCARSLCSHRSPISRLTKPSAFATC